MRSRSKIERQLVWGPVLEYHVVEEYIVKKEYVHGLKMAVAPVVLGIAMISTPSFAQEKATTPAPAAAENEQEQIVVTGSRIARPNIELSSPVNVIGKEEIEYRQPTSIEDVLRTLPGAIPGLGSAVNNGSNGTATFNLRGLGTNRNLVLLNSRRVVAAGTNGVSDLNILPVALLERSEVLTGGASSVYGADAISGVLNFITKKNFSGLQVDANYGITERGDGGNFRVDLTAGTNFGGGRGNAVISFGYTDTKPVLQGSRDIGKVSISSASGAPQGSATATPASIFFPIANSRFDPATGTIVPGASDFNFNPLNVFQTPLKRYNLFAQANYEVTPNIEAFVEGFYTRTDVQQRIAPSGTFFNNFQVPLNNKFLTPAQASQLCTASVGIAGGLPAGTNCAAAIAAGTEVTTQIGRRFTEAGSRLTNFVGTSFQFTAGLRGDLTSNLKWELSSQYGQVKFTNTQNGQGLASRLQQALRACPAGSASGCVPINIFGADGTLTQDMFNFLNVPTSQFVKSDLSIVQGSITGDLGFSSPFADEPVGIAVGAEYRKFTGSSGGDAASATAGEVLGAGAPALPVNGRYNTKEGFIELNIPVVSDRPYFYNLSLEGGYRYSDYSTGFKTNTYKYGGSWSPVKDIKFRAIYARSVRAPNIQELFRPQVIGLNNLAIDPCQGTVAQVTARGANVPALCIAQTAAGQFGNIPAPSAGQINQTTGGNPLLKPEIADSFTAGIVLQPEPIPGLTITADYFDIDIRDAISEPTVADVLDTCYAATNTNANLPACLNIQRNPLTGGLSGPQTNTPGVFRGSSNQGTLETNGIDFGITYRRNIGSAKLTLNGVGTYTFQNLFQATPASINRECVGYYSTSCGNPQPKMQWNLRTTLAFGGTDISLLWRHLAAVKVEPVAPAARVSAGVPTTGGPVTVFAAFKTIPAYDYFDLSLRQSVGNNLQFTLAVLNLFDKNAPAVGNTIGTTATNTGNTFPSVYDALGRRFTFAARLKF
jgi:iron complex outermembrane recepter protein